MLGRGGEGIYLENKEFGRYPTSERGTRSFYLRRWNSDLRSNGFSLRCCGSELRAGRVGSGDLTVPSEAQATKPKNADNKVRSPQSPDLVIAARWGYSGQGGVTMPGPGKTTSGTRGQGFLDIHLNATTRWKDVPEPVWTYTLGGYKSSKSGSATASNPSSSAR